MFSADSWRQRVLDGVEAEDIEFPQYRAVFEAIELDAPDRLDEIAARTYESLKSEGLGERSADEMFLGALNRLEAKRLDREVASMRGMIPLAREEDKAQLIVEFQQLVKRRNTKRPTYNLA